MYMHFIYVLTVSTTLWFSDGKVQHFVNEFEYTSMERCITARKVVEADRGQPKDGWFRVLHVGMCKQRKSITIIN